MWLSGLDMRAELRGVHEEMRREHGNVVPVELDGDVLAWLVPARARRGPYPTNRPSCGPAAAPAGSSGGSATPSSTFSGGRHVDLP
ncbi:hypothetical protein [Streptomyces sp. NPDC051636]|uniref:hypothetical protein n=1 Tax=Streptomyces sp. NPDC051636 TaxID=3365663 RepID=UPI0037BC0B88